MSLLALDAEALYADLVRSIRGLLQPDTHLLGVTSGGVAGGASAKRPEPANAHGHHFVGHAPRRLRASRYDEFSADPNSV